MRSFSAASFLSLLVLVVSNSFTRYFNKKNYILLSLVGATPFSKPQNGHSKNKLGREMRTEEDFDGYLTLANLDSLNCKPIFDPNNSFHSDSEHTILEEQRNPQSTKNKPKILLDLSGRIMCHIFSPPKNSRSQAASPTFTSSRESNSMPLFHVPTTKLPAQLQLMNRFVPHFYLGSDYDLDEIWYGATRWIARCVWGPSDEAVHLETTHQSQMQRQQSQQQRITITKATKKFMTILFPTSPLSTPSPFSSWDINMELERSVADWSDNTFRLVFKQAQRGTNNRSQDNKDLTSLFFSFPQQQLTMEYDSAKYSFDTNSAGQRISTTELYAPTLSLQLKTPILHPRLLLHSKRTWIVKEQLLHEEWNDKQDSHIRPVENRLEQIKERYRSNLPQSTHHLSIARKHSLSGEESETKVAYLKNLWKSFGLWIENDGWMPQSLTTDLLGNFVSLNEIGFGNRSSNKMVGAHFEKDELVTSAIEEGPEIKCHSRYSNFGSTMDNMGIRLRISKKIDWPATFGIFPWRNNSRDSIGKGDRKGSNFSRTDSIRARLEFCGLNKSEDRRVCLGIEVDPFDWLKTFMIVLSHEDTLISALGT